MTTTLEVSTAVVVVNFGGPRLLAANLVPLADAAPQLTIVVVDNASTAEARAGVERLIDEQPWHAIFAEENLGFGGGMNLGVAKAIELGCERILLLNPDAVIGVEAVDALVARSVEAPLSLLAPRILRPDGSVWFDGTDLYLSDGRIRSNRRRQDHPGERVEPWLSGACLLVSAELWRLVGGFLDDYFLYWEDVDLSHRVLAAGGALEVVRGAVAVHDEGGTHDQGAGAAASAPGAGAAAGAAAAAAAARSSARGRRPGAGAATVAANSGTRTAANRAKSETYYYFTIRNRLVFGAKHLSGPELRRWRRASIPIAWEVLLQGGRRQFLSSLAPLRAGFAGVRDGLRASRRPERDER